MASEQAVSAAMAVWGIGDWSDALEAAFPIMLRDKMNGQVFTQKHADAIRRLVDAQKVEFFGMVPDGSPEKDTIVLSDAAADLIEGLLPLEGT